LLASGQSLSRHLYDLLHLGVTSGTPTLFHELSICLQLSFHSMFNTTLWNGFLR